MAKAERTYFIRRYQKGVKNSGTNDVFISEEPIELDDFVRIAHNTGDGKYLLGERGKGIRGFKKITDCVVEPLPEVPVTDQTVWNSEFVSVKKNVRLAEMENRDLMDLMGSMSRSNFANEGEYDKFRSDLSALHAEFSRRGFAGDNALAAESAFTGKSLAQELPIAGAGFSPIMAGTIGALLGGVVSWIGTSHHYKNKIDDLTRRIDELGATVKEAESAVKRAEDKIEKTAKTAEAVAKYDAKMQGDSLFLSQFNRMSGPQMR